MSMQIIKGNNLPLDYSKVHSKDELNKFYLWRTLQGVVLLESKNIIDYALEAALDREASTFSPMIVVSLTLER